ncbi:unnamed protein product [Paramecium pentaurelia]|uniref:Protein kinase domain-containing protein n=1 Tax=Paramecium pentaurelia TaxID=43138 RepID=A0A8S1XPJ2_9CILI|nr:unnamed protein product [Paramecium pentaurelia]
MDKNDRDQYIIEETETKLISMGQYGQIYECQRKDGKQKEPLCVKIIKKKEHTMNQSLNEIKILAKVMKLKPENLVNIIHIFEQIHQFEIIMERCDMDLEQEFNILQKNKLWYTDEECFNILTQITNGIRILNQNNILHRDIKPSNILVKIKNKGRRVYKITDFGFSKISENYCKTDYYTTMGTPLYASPQIFNQQAYSGKCDIYSFGIILYQIFFNGNMPIVLQTKSDLQNFHQILKKKEFQCQLPNYSYAEQIVDLLQKMIVYKEEERISFDQLFQHPILNIKKQFLFQDSIFNSTSIILYNLQTKHISNLLDIVYQIQEIFYRKYLFYKSVCKKFSIDQQIYKKAALFCLLFLGMKQLNYYMGFIHIIISDIHPHFQKNNFDTLLQHLKLCQNNLNLHPQYQQQIIQVKKEYYNEKKYIANYNNQLQKDLILIQGSPKFLSSFIEMFYQSNYKRIEQQQIIDMLKFFLDQKLLDGFEASVQAAISLDEQFPIQNFQLINPNDIYLD